jgi:hypothetical protein
VRPPQATRLRRFDDPSRQRRVGRAGRRNRGRDVAPRRQLETSKESRTAPEHRRLRSGPQRWRGTKSRGLQENVRRCPRMSANVRRPAADSGPPRRNPPCSLGIPALSVRGDVSSARCAWSVFLWVGAAGCLGWAVRPAAASMRWWRRSSSQRSAVKHSTGGFGRQRAAGRAGECSISSRVGTGIAQGARSTPRHPRASPRRSPGPRQTSDRALTGGHGRPPRSPRDSGCRLQAHPPRCPRRLRSAQS